MTDIKPSTQWRKTSGKSRLAQFHFLPDKSVNYKPQRIIYFHLRLSFSDISLPLSFVLLFM
jgi:hypothetical protein